MSDDDKKWKTGTMELATLRRADAEQRKVEEAAKWREMIADFIDWLKQKFK